MVSCASAHDGSDMPKGARKFQLGATLDSKDGVMEDAKCGLSSSVQAPKGKQNPRRPETITHEGWPQLHAIASWPKHDGQNMSKVWTLALQTIPTGDSLCKKHSNGSSKEGSTPSI